MGEGRQAHRQNKHSGLLTCCVITMPRVPSLLQDIMWYSEEDTHIQQVNYFLCLFFSDAKLSLLQPYLVPVQKETIEQTPYNLLPTFSFLFFLQVFKHTCPLLPHLIIYLDQLLLVQMIMAPMIRRNLPRLLYMSEEVNKPRPRYCARRRIPILYFVGRMDWHQFLRLYSDSTQQ